MGVGTSFSIVGSGDPTVRVFIRPAKEDDRPSFFMHNERSLDLDSMVRASSASGEDLCGPLIPFGASDLNPTQAIAFL